VARIIEHSNKPAGEQASVVASDKASGSAVITSMNKPKNIGLLMFFLVFGVFGIWASVAPIEGAAHAPGSVTVRSNRQLVQHLEGGIVKEIVARNGDRVRAGDALLILDDTQPLAQLEITNLQYLAMSAMEARLIAERDGLEQINFPADLSTLAQNAESEISSQTQVFLTRKAALDGSVEVLEQRIGQLQSRLGGLRALQQSKQDLADSFAEELRDVQSLLVEGFADKNRVRELERNAAQLRGEAAELTANISSTEIEIGETRLQILQQEREFQNGVANELAEVQTGLKDANERLTALRSIVQRTTITAPVDGIVNGMQVHTVGGVVPPGQPLADIVPQNEELIVEARISPMDIDRVAIGQEAMVRFSSFSSSVPNIFGNVINVSADALADPNTGMAYYSARVEVTPEGLRDLGSLTLIPGMPADVFISTGSRTLLQYMMKPISSAMARSFIED
jgi:epimerase transport system membrane fusion protein